MLKRAVERYPGIRTEAITHARHADIVGVLRACGASSVSIELDMFQPEDGKALHDAGFSNRVHLPRPEVLAEYWRGGRDPVPSLVQWVADGLIDTLSGRSGRLTAMNLEPISLDNRLQVAEAVVREAGRVAADHCARRELSRSERPGRWRRASRNV